MTTNSIRRMPLALESACILFLAASGSQAQSDSCSSATPCTAGVYYGDTTGSLSDGSSTCGADDVSPDVWFSFTATQDSRVQISTCSSGWDTVLSVHSGCPGTRANEIACNDDSCSRQSIVTVVARTGTVLLIRVAGWRGQRGPFTMSIDRSPLVGDGGDLYARDVSGLQQFSRVGDVVGCAAHFSVCNVGNQPIDWFENPDPRHPFTVLNLYRVTSARIEQVGQSWAKHGHSAGAGNDCGLGCQVEPDHHRFGVGCSDVYIASLNATQTELGPRNEINPWTGSFTFTGSHQDTDTEGHDPIEHRLQLHDVDIDPAQNPGATYICEMQLVAHDDLNHANNVVSKSVRITGAPGGVWSFDMDTSTLRLEPAVKAWTGARFTVIPRPGSNDGRCVVAAKATANGDGTWHYEYAVYDNDMDRGVGSFQIPVPASARVSNIGFHGVESAGEPYSNDSWRAVRSGETLTWSTDPFEVNPRSNPIRWGTLYNFRFDCDVAPSDTTATLGLYKPGTPGALQGTTTGPTVGLCRAGTVDRGNGVARDVLLVNGRSGQAPFRVIDVARNQPLTVSLSAAPSGPSIARYSLWVWPGGPLGDANVVLGGQTLGCTVNPNPLDPTRTPQPIRCLQGGAPAILCGNVAGFASTPRSAPWSFAWSRGIRIRSALTLQGVLEDAGAANSMHFSVTNAVWIRVR